ncbi:MAG: Maltodextrin import ATP-binding protein MsmX, partial [Actinomycetota bacterium]
AVLHIGDQTIGVAASVIAAKPSLFGYDGQDVAVGIRPEHLEDATLAREANDTLTGTVTIREGLGSEVLLHVELNAQVVSSDGASTTISDKGTASLVARVDPHTGVKEGDSVRLAVDVSQLHLFDLSTGRAIR